jgi:hypothetical protein
MTQAKLAIDAASIPRQFTYRYRRKSLARTCIANATTKYATSAPVAPASSRR